MAVLDPLFRWVQESTPLDDVTRAVPEYTSHLLDRAVVEARRTLIQLVYASLKRLAIATIIIYCVFHPLLFVKTLVTAANAIWQLARYAGGHAWPYFRHAVHSLHQRLGGRYYDMQAVHELPTHQHPPGEDVQLPHAHAPSARHQEPVERFGPTQEDGGHVGDTGRGPAATGRSSRASGGEATIDAGADADRQPRPPPARSYGAQTGRPGGRGATSSSRGRLTAAQLRGGGALRRSARIRDLEEAKSARSGS